MNWEKTGTKIYATGERTVTYAFMQMKIESRRRLIPRGFTGETGSWLRTTYFLIWPDGYEEEFITLRDAKEKGEKEVLKCSKCFLK